MAGKWIGDFGRTWAFAFALSVGATAGGCNASLSELEDCGKLAEAVCSSGKDCGLEWNAADCKRQLSRHCSGASGVVSKSKGDEEDSESSSGSSEEESTKSSSAEDCAEDLKDQCLPDVPTSCGDLSRDLGCTVCSPDAPGDAVIDACCALNPFSAVCGGC